MNLLLPALVFFPMLGGIVCYLIGRVNKTARDWTVVAWTAVEFLGALYLLTSTATAQLGGVCDLGMRFAAGSFHGFMAVLASMAWLAATLLCREYFATMRNRNRFYLFWQLTLGATMGIFLAADLFTFFIFFEVMSCTSYVLVIHNENKAGLRAGGGYLAFAIVGGMVTLCGLFLLYAMTGTLELSGLRAACAGVENRAALMAAGTLCLFGFGVKAGMIGLHTWLPYSYENAPEPATAMLSAVLSKCGVFGVICLTIDVMAGTVAAGFWSNFLLILALATMLVGGAAAVMSANLKRTVAFSSMSQIGFILFGVAMCGLLGEENAIASAGTSLHIMNHTLIKLVLFCAAGVIWKSTRTFDLNRLRGWGRNKPWLAVVMILPMLSVAGIPGFSGYASKTLLHESIVEYRHILAAAGGHAAPYVAAEWLFLLAGGCTLAYMLKLFVCLFVEKPRTQPEKQKIMSPLTAVVLFLPGLAMLCMGVTPGQTMIPIANYAQSFYSAEAMHPIAFFSGVNLAGGCYSLAIGLLIYLLFVRLVVVHNRRYRLVWPKVLNLEEIAWRPLLMKILPFGGAFVARVLDTSVNGFVAFLGRVLYVNRTRTVVPPESPHFAAYAEKPRKPWGSQYSFSFGLGLCGAGMLVALVYLIIRFYAG